MLKKIFLWACVLLFTSGFDILNAQFQFSYTGPDTLYLNNNCSVQLNWGAPATPTATSTIGNTITSFELFNISGGFQIGSLIDHETTVEITYKAIDNQLNSAFFTFNIAIEDTLRPQINTLPSDKSFTCETPESTIISQLYLWYNNHAGMVASDNCGVIQYVANKTLQEVETAFNQSINDNCGSTRSITVIFSAKDQYGNTSANSYAATFFTFDNQDPVPVTNPLPLRIECNEQNAAKLEAWIDNKGGAKVLDNCTDTSNIVWYISWKRVTGTGNDLELIGDKPYNLKANHTCKDSVNVNFIYKDECNNSHAFFTTYSAFDNSVPVFSQLPADTIINCSVPIPRPPVTAYDACKGNLVVQFLETSTQHANPDSCKHYIYQITQKWNANDECGHAISHSRKIIVQDTTAPSYIAPANISVGCTDFENLDITGRPMNVNDNCSTNIKITFSDEKLGENCQYHIFRKWKISDVCQNTSEFTQDLTIIDTIFPVVVKPPVDITIKCDSSISFKESFDRWIANKAYSEITDNCNKIYFFAAKPGSYLIGLPNTYPGVPVSFDMNDSLSCSNDTLLYYKDVDFVFRDRCQNAISFTRRFAIIDQDKPVIKTCPQDTSFVIETGKCEKEVQLTMPEVSDNCTGKKIEIIRNITKPIRSNIQGSYEVPVNPVTLEFGPFSAVEKIPVSIDSFKLHFENIDANEPSEFFYIVGENDDTIGTTPIIAGQCEDFDVYLKDLIDLNSFQQWLADGYLSLRLLPNVPPGSGIFAINDICNSSSSVSAKLIYHRDNPNKLNYYIKIDNGDYSFAGNGSKVDTILNIGDHLIHYKITDCGNNEIQCSNKINIIDKESPNINCPTNITRNLQPDSCYVSIDLPLDISITDNCSNTFNKFIRVPSDTSKAYMTFNFNTEYNDYVANSKLFEFNNLNSQYLLLDPVLEVKITGDIDESNEYFEILNENGQIIGTSSNANSYTTHGNCDVPSVTKLNINIDQFRNWTTDDKVIFTARPANTPNPINPCLPVNSNGSSDSKSKIFMTLVFKTVQLMYSVEGPESKDFVPFNFESSQDIKFKSGISHITYKVDDGSGNLDSCTFNIEVKDIEKPVAKCKNYQVLFVNPSGTENAILDPASINENSSDNCEIDSMSVFPNSFTCLDDNTNKDVVLTVWDKAGNSDSCSTSILVKVMPLAPSYSSGVCIHDTLRLFANLPPAPPNVWNIEWTGPDGFISHDENPFRLNANTNYSGTYVLSVTGFNGCTSVGTLEVIVEDLSRPLIKSNKNKICDGEEITLEATSYSSNVRYYWYSGSYPVGTFIDSTKTRFISLKPKTGNNFYYVIAWSERCQSLASFSTIIEVVPKPHAVITTPFISLCEGEVFAPTAAMSGNGDTYKWWGPNGFTSNHQNPAAIQNISIINQGTYFLELSNSVCSDTAEMELVVFNKPDIPKLNYDSIVCKNQAIIITVSNNQNADNYIWYLNDKLYLNQVSNTLLIPEAKPQFEGKWKAVVKEGNCYSDTSIVANIRIEEEYQVVVESNSPVCQGDSVKLLAPSIYNAIYKWSGPEGFISEQQNPVLLSEKSGEYILKLTTQAGCKYNSSTFVDIKIRPVITALSSDAPECISPEDCIKFKPTIYPFGSGYKYYWNGPNNFTSAQYEPEICNFNLLNNGVYSLLVNDGLCNSDTSFIEINSKLKPLKPVIDESLKVCEGDSAKIYILNNIFSEGTTYNWTISPGNQSIKTTKPYLVIEQTSLSNNGKFSVTAEKDGCLSSVSDELILKVIKRPNQPYITGTEKVCENGTIELKTSVLPDGKYHWTGPDNFSSSFQNPKIFPAKLSHSGIYTVSVSVESCYSSPSEGFKVDVISLPQTPEIIQTDTSYCIGKGSKISLCLKNIEANTNYSWYQNGLPSHLIGEASGKCLDIIDFTNIVDGLNNIFVLASRDNCKSDNSTVYSFTLNKIPERKADAGKDVFSCSPDGALIAANPDPEGKWKPANPAAFVKDPAKSSTNVYDLDYSNNAFIWSLTHGVCHDFSSDTTIVYVETFPEINNDSYQTSYNTTLSFDPVKNDENTEDTKLDIQGIGDIHGKFEILSNGTVRFIPDPGFIGQIMLNYTLTKSKCKDNSDSGTITIDIGDKDDCFGVNVITPNGDGINDNLVFPCLESGVYNQNEIIVFNQWGDQVYTAYNYKNDWSGTYNNKDLPVGTYFYILFLDNERKRSLKGFFVIER